MIRNLKLCLKYLLLLGVLGLVACGSTTSKTVEIRGIYGNPKPLWDKGYHLNDLGVNAIFVHSGSINEEMINRARTEGAKVYAEFATLNGKGYVDTHPEAWAINELGEKVEAATWFMGVCPTEPGFRKYRFDQLRNLLLEYDLDGVWMDYVHWHAQFEDPEPILPETCFCKHCLMSFSQDNNIRLPDATTPEKAAYILSNHNVDWRKWRCQVIYDWAVDIKNIIAEIKPNALLGLYHCPWNDEEYNGARERILGLDYELLKKTVDVFSPMVYHQRMERDPHWVQENIEWFSQKIGAVENAYPKIWPIVQAYNEPGIVTNEAFETVLRGGLAGKSTGVMMFTTNAIAEDKGKTEVMKKVYTEVQELPKE
jgi:hypothetical protein